MALGVSHAAERPGPARSPARRARAARPAQQAQRLQPLAAEREPRGLALQPVLSRSPPTLPARGVRPSSGRPRASPRAAHPRTPPEARPVPERRCRRVRPMQENQVGDRALVLAPLASRGSSLPRVGRTHVYASRCPAGSHQRRSASITSRARSSKHAVRPGLHERQTAQPGEQLRPLAISKDAAQEPRRRRPARGPRHSSAIRWRGLSTPARKLSTSRATTSGAAPTQRPHIHIRFRLPLRDHRSPPAATMRAGGRARARASNPCCSSATPAPRRRARASSGPRLREGHHTQQVAAPWIPTPRRRESISARYHNQRTCRQWRDEPLPQPVLEPDRSLEGVQQQHRALVAGKRLLRRRLCRQPASARPSSAMNAGGEGWIGRRDQRHDAPPASAAASRGAEPGGAVLPTPRDHGSTTTR